MRSKKTENNNYLDKSTELNSLTVILTYKGLGKVVIGIFERSNDDKSDEFINEDKSD